MTYDSCKDLTFDIDWVLSYNFLIFSVMRRIWIALSAAETVKTFVVHKLVGIYLDFS